MKFIIIALILSGCTLQKKEASHSAILISKSGSTVSGKIIFDKTLLGVFYSGHVTGLKPNFKHGFHIHEFGDCSSLDGKSAGGHFNPSGHQHGAPHKELKHVGDLGNLITDSKGVAHFSKKALPKDLLNSSHSHFIIGKAVIIHDKTDDLKSQPTGNAGKRIACGVIR